jgi:propanol-preferring alcohol dehydrogenase
LTRIGVGYSWDIQPLLISLLKELKMDMHESCMRLHQFGPVESRPLIWEEIKIPAPGSNQVRIRIIYCGVCHTDLHTVEGEIHPPKLPIIPGHQVVGVIEALGNRAAQSGLRVGDRVGVAWLHAADGSCTYCQKGLQNLCPAARFTGFDVDGGYAGAMLAEAPYVLSLPDGVADADAAPLLCAGIIGYRSLRQADVQPGEHVGLVGFGASAHLAIQVARHSGCEVSVFTRSAAHRQHALELGASWVGGVDESPLQPLDRAVIFAPAGALVPVTLEKLRPGGTLAINAVYMSDIPAFPYRVIYGERTLRSVANATMQDGIEFLKLAEEIHLTPTITLYNLADANQALMDMKHSRINGEAVLKI